MEKNLSDNILNVCKVLTKNHVEYIIVGGTAVALHGYFRRSMNQSGIATEKPDLDFWYNPTYKNYFNLLNALEELGQDVSEFRNEQAPNPQKSFFRYKFEKFTLDLLPAIKAQLPFRSAYEKRDVVTLNEIEIPFLNYSDLILDKSTNPRPKDIDDIKNLRDREGQSG